MSRKNGDILAIGEGTQISKSAFLLTTHRIKLILMGVIRHQ